MSRAPASHAESIVDAVLLASRGATFEREFSLAELPRLAEVGAGTATRIHAVLRFFEYERCAALKASLTGCVVLQCQRCLDVYEMPLDEDCELVLVADEQKAPVVSEEQDLVVAEAERLDLRWLVDEQALLALPLVALHEDCGESVTEQNDTAVTEPRTEAEQPSVQKPFANLSDLLQRKR
jgi:uncharacterized protein